MIFKGLGITMKHSGLDSFGSSSFDESQIVLVSRSLMEIFFTEITGLTIEIWKVYTYISKLLLIYSVGRFFLEKELDKDKVN